MDMVTLGAARAYTDESISGTGGALAGKNCKIKSIVKSGKTNTVTFEWTADDGTTKESIMIVKDGSGEGGGGGSSALTAEITANVEVGGVAVGKNYPEGTELEEIIRDMLVKYIAPGLSFAISPSTTPVLKGTSIASTTLSATVTKKSNAITKVAFKVGSDVVKEITEGVADGGSFSHTYDTAITSTTKFSVEVSDGSTGAKSEKTITFCDATYFGTLADTVSALTEDIIKTLTKKAVNSKGMTYSGISMTYGKIAYAYPKSYGALTSIKDANNVDYINSYTRTEVTVDGVVYYAYLLTDAAGVSNFKQVYA